MLTLAARCVCSCMRLNCTSVSQHSPRNLAVVQCSPITHPLSSQQQEEERLAQELEDNRGVSLHLQLSAAPADMASAAARGIKRAADKLLLPPSAGASLLNQSASRNGAMLFEVAASNGGRTHAGVLEVRGGVKGEQGDCRCGAPGALVLV